MAGVAEEAVLWTSPIPAFQQVRAPEATGEGSASHWRILARAGEGTKIIPGHGPLGTKADLKTYRDMLATSRDRVAALVKAGKTLEQVTAAKPTADLDAKWGQGFIKPDPWVSILYKDLSRPAG